MPAPAADLHVGLGIRLPLHPETSIPHWAPESESQRANECSRRNLKTCGGPARQRAASHEQDLVTFVPKSENR